MRADRNVPNSSLKRALRLSIAVAGVAAVVGSGGGDWGCIPFDEPCDGPYPPVPPPPYPTVDALPSLATTTVGASAVYEAVVTNMSSPSYQWCRIPPGGGVCADIPAATAVRYTTAAANLADDGARFAVKLKDANGQVLAISSSARLAVSPAPAVVFQDGEFQSADWSATAIVSPAQGGPAYAIARPASGGNPGAFMSVEYQMPQVSSSVRVLHVAPSAVYDPATQGSIYTIDFTEDCRRVAGSHRPYTAPLIRQGGRTYVGRTWHERECASSAWQAVTIRASLAADDFTLLDGPACGATESCPDFSAVGAPIRFGLLTGATVGNGYPAGTTTHGIDNWRASVWRR